jgi:hypothetical protein
VAHDPNAHIPGKAPGYFFAVYEANQTVSPVFYHGTLLDVLTDAE